jgi:hypothetical protein
VANKSTTQNSEGQQPSEWIDEMSYEANKHIDRTYATGTVLALAQQMAYERRKQGDRVIALLD